MLGQPPPASYKCQRYYILSTFSLKYLSNSIKITTNTDKSVTQSNLLGQASASYANDSLSCPYFLPHKLLPTTRTRSPSFAGRKRRRSGKQSVVCNIGSAVAFNWFLFAITGLQQLQEIGIGCISAADNFESPTRPIIFFKAHRLNISEM